MWAWQFAKAQHVAERNGWTKFVSMQNHYNLLYREEEREMLPLCADQGVGVIPWSPLARGKLTRDWDESTARSETDEFGKTLYAHGEPGDRRPGRRDRRRSEACPGRRSALAWVARSRWSRADRRRDEAPAPRRRDRLGRLTLSDEEIEQLEEPYTPQPVTGFV